MFVSSDKPLEQTGEKEPSQSDLEQMRDRLGWHVARAMENIAKIHETGKEKCSSSAKHLMFGYWQAHELSDALNQKNTKNTLAWDGLFKNNLHYLRGRFPSQFFVRHRFSNYDDFILSEKCKASEAMIAAQDGFATVDKGVTILQCSDAVVLAFYEGLYTFLLEANGEEGKEKYDRLFSLPHGEPMNMTFRCNGRQPLWRLVKFIKDDAGTLGHRPVKEGQACCFLGVPKYGTKHPFGAGSCFNTVCNHSTEERQTFTCLDLPSEGVDEMGIYLALAEEYNIERSYLNIVPESMVPHAFDRFSVALLQDTVETTPEALPQVVKGYVPGSVMDFSTPLIYAIVLTPVEKICSDFVENHPFANTPHIDPTLSTEEVDLKAGQILTGWSMEKQ